jgi:DNA-binding transcriptional MerR regulator
MSPPTLEGLSITQLAVRASVRPDTIRYYERTGLLPEPARTTGGSHGRGWRRYDAQALDRLQFIRGAKRLGLRLDAIAELLELRDTGQCPCDSAADKLSSRLAEVDEEIAQLAGLREQLQIMLAAIPGTSCPDPAPGTWCPPGSDAGCGLGDSSGPEGR